MGLHAQVWPTTVVMYDNWVAGTHGANLGTSVVTQWTYPALPPCAAFLHILPHWARTKQPRKGMVIYSAFNFFFADIPHTRICVGQGKLKRRGLSCCSTAVERKNW